MRYYLELQIRKEYDVQALPEVLIGQISQLLGENGRAVSATPKYHMSDKAGASLATVNAAGKILFLQYISVEIILYNSLNGIKDIQDFVKSEGLGGLCRLKFQSESYNLLNENAV